MTSVGLDTPVFVTSWPDNPELLVVVERGGARVTLWDLAALDAGPTTVLDLGGDASTAQEAYTPTSTTNDFLGITAVAFHPKFHDAPSGSQRFFYVRYNRVFTTEPGFGPTYRTFVKRYKIAPGKVSATTASATVVYTFPTQLTGHGSGTLAFDRRANLPSARLYVPMPDHAPGLLGNFGGTGANHACCLAAQAQGAPAASEVGRLLAIDVDVAGFPLTVEAQGLRNPWGTTVDRGDATTGAGRGDVWIGDTGHLFTGSVMRLAPVGPVVNYGWPWVENNGNLVWLLQPAQREAHCHSSPMLYTLPLDFHSCPEVNPAPSYVAPFLGFSDLSAFGQGAIQDAIIGGIQYRGDAVPALTNQYIFGTFGLGRAPRVYAAAGPSPSAPSRLLSGGVDITLAAGWTSNMQLQAFGEDWWGKDLYLVAVDSTFPGVITDNGSIWKVLP